MAVASARYGLTDSVLLRPSPKNVFLPKLAERIFIQPFRKLGGAKPSECGFPVRSFHDNHVLGSKFVQQESGLCGDDDLPFDLVEKHPGGLFEQTSQQRKGIRVQTKFRLIEQNGR